MRPPDRSSREGVLMPALRTSTEMRYIHQKHQSAELLRAAVAHMGQHEAACNPLTFTVWYEYAAGINPRLVAAIEQEMKQGSRLDDAAIERLYRDFVTEPDEAEVRRLSGEFQRVMSRMTDSANHTGEAAGAFGAQLDRLSSAIQAKDTVALLPDLAETLGGTAQMKDSVQALQDQVRSSQQEIAQLQTALLRARDEAQIDGLTRVLNRKGFDERLEAMLRAMQGTAGQGCLVMLDIDHFKKVNDTHGHLMGDQVLRGLGKILPAMVTQEGHAVARFGGEEFAVLMPGASLEESRQLAERVLNTTKAMKLRDRKTQQVLLTVTVSAGVAAATADDDATSLIARADAALYQSKQGGRDRVTCA